MESKNLDVTVGCLAAVDTILPEPVALGVVFVFTIMYLWSRDLVQAAGGRYLFT